MKIIFTKKVIWAAGIAAATMPGLTDESYHKNGRLIVDEFLRLKTSESIFAIGDVAFVEGINGHPQVAPVAWVMWLGVHIYFLIGVKNKIVVMFNWVWAYLFFDQGLRLLIKPKIKNN